MISTGRLVVDNVELDLDKGIPFPLNFSIADIKEPEKRKRNFSKKVTLPGTPTNLAFFASTYNLSLTTLDNTVFDGFTFDPTTRVEAKYYKKGILVFDGLIQVNEVIINDKDYSFECTLYSDFIDIFTNLRNVKISELGWSEYDHTLSRTNIENSWDTSVVVNGTPTSNFTTGNPDGFGYLYPLINYGFPQQAPTTFKTTHLMPFVYWKEILDKCFELAGVTYSSSFLDSTLFKKFIFGFGGGTIPSLSSADVAERQCNFDGDYSSSQTLSYVSSVGTIGGGYQLTFPSFSVQSLIQNSNFTDNVIQDTLGQYDATTGEISIAKSGRYKIDVSAVLQYTLNTGAMTVDQTPYIVGFGVRRNNIAIPSSLNTSLAINGSNTINSVIEVDLVQGDILTMELFFTGSVKTSVASLADAESISLTIADTTDIVVDITSIETSITDGATINLSRYIPELDADKFLEAVIKACNLMISDPDIDNVVTIEPLEDYYQDTNVFDDITDIVDHDEPIVIEPASSVIEGKFYRFLFTEDNDYDNKRYHEQYGVGYGDYTFTVQSTFQTGERVYKLPFAQSVPVDIINTSLVLPRIIQFDENTQQTKTFKGKPRVFIYNGLKSGNWRLTNTDDITQYDDLTSYPCAHHLDDIDNPSFDLNFGVPLILYYDAPGYTTDNLFTRYHERFVREITGKDSKIVKLYLKTDADRINKLDFSLLKMWNGVLYRLNEVVDYDEDATNSTMYELVKILKANDPKKYTTTIGPIRNVTDIQVVSGGQNSPDNDVTVLTGGIKGPSKSSSIFKDA